MGFKQNIFRINVFLQDPNKKPAAILFREFFSIWRKKKRFPIHYIGRLMYRKGFENPEDYMDMEEYKSIVFPVRNNPEAYVHMLSNKLIFHVFCEKYKLPVPRMLGYNMRSSFFMEDNLIPIDSEKDLISYFEEMFKVKKAEVIFLKAFCGFMGKHVHKLTLENVGEDVPLLKETLLNGEFIFQEGVQQIDSISKIYPSSVNTLRVETFIDNQGTSHILGAVLRLGSGGKYIDNVSSGGFFVPIEMKNGTLKKKGVRAMIHGGEEIFEHPDTGFVFEKFKIPFFDECKELAVKLATHFPNRIAGWDLAITEEGPVVIEGNNQPGITIGELSYGGYAKHPLFDEMRGLKRE